MSARRLIVVVFLMVLGGCGDRKLVVESSTSWRGTITKQDGSELVVGGLSDTTIVNLGGGQVCWLFRKNETKQGELVVFMLVPTITGTDRRGEGRTSAAGEPLEGCSG